MAETTFQKRALIDGVGNLFLTWMTAEGTSVTAPTYGEEIYETPSIEQIEVALTVNSKDVFLSNVIHDSKETVTKAEINLQAGYFPEGFAEEAQGMVKLGTGAWAMPTTPVKKPFTMRVPITDSSDGEIILIFPYCTLGVANTTAQTRKEDTTEQIPTYTITSTPLLYKKEPTDKRSVYLRVDLTSEEAAKAWDRAKLLTTAIYDKTTLETAKKAGLGG